MNIPFRCIVFSLLFIILSCKNISNKDTQLENTKNKNLDIKTPIPFIWEGANIYFLLTDRFNNGDITNDKIIDRTKKTGKLRGFEGGDIKGITQKIEEGYFSNLGINVIWFTPVVEQIYGSVNEGTGNTYAYHGYWAKDWTKIDPNFGTFEDLEQLVKTAHKNGIRILMDVVINHTGPVTDQDPVWPDTWVRTTPQCDYKNYENTVSCTLVKNLPDIKTESDKNVELPEILTQKWKAEGRLEKELLEIETFFNKTGLKKSPKNYIIKWLTDYVRKLGIDGYRVDTTKHVEENTWKTLAEQAKLAFIEWKSKNPNLVLDTNEFYMLGELYGYNIHNKRNYEFTDRKIDYYAYGFDNLINFQFKYDAENINYEKLFSVYSKILYTNLIGKGVTNYISSHDDNSPFDKSRTKTYESATKLLLSPGISQIYYGDEIARPLTIIDTKGDANLRSNMNWKDINNEDTKNLLKHWQKLGVFRKNHPAVGAGKHRIISEKPYVFSRVYNKNEVLDKVVIGLNLNKGKKIIKINSLFAEGEILIDQYSGVETKVNNDAVTIISNQEIVLLELKK